MLNRRQLRFKAFQGLYAHLSSAENDIVKSENELLKSIEASKELMVWQLSLILELHYYSVRKTEDAKLKLLPTEGDLNPNMRFIDNRFIKQLSENKSVEKMLRDYHVSWIENGEMIRRIYNTIKSSSEYEEYINSEDTYANDKNFIINMYLRYIFTDEGLVDLYETKNIYWYTDFYSTQYTLVKFFETFFKEGEDFGSNEDLIKRDKAQFDEDKKFATELFRNTIRQREKTFNLIKSKIQNWDIDRISLTDFVILQMALTELMYFPIIPIRVSLNEYIEMAKAFSSPKSKVFINGILDNLIGDLKNSGEIQKTGRGLM